MQKAIDYIEDNLLLDLDYLEISKHAYSSSFHFQRVFSILCGYTIGEYIRNRRLTLAGEELSMSNAKVIDVALKYGYENPERFEKITAPELTYAIFETKRMKYPTSSHLDLRKKIVAEWLPSSQYILAEGPEITVTHWFKNPDSEKRYIELWLPVETKIY